VIWATVIFGSLEIVQQWQYLRDEIGHDGEPHDFILLLTTEARKQVVLRLDRDRVNFEGPVPCYLGVLHANNAGMLP